MMKHNLANTQLYKYSSLKIFFVLIALLGISFLNSCKDNPVDDGNEPPCFECFDFRLTDFEPAWSPDGKTIAYVHSDTINGKTGIYLIDTSGNNRRIFYVSSSAYSPSLSPDGDWIAFSDQAQIFKMKVNGDSLTQLTFEGRNFFPNWSPDGQWIAYDSNNESPNGMYFIWKMKSNGNQKKRIAYDISNGEIRMPNWSQEGERISHIRYLVGVFSSEIFVMDTSGTNSVRLTFNNSTDYYPKYSPDGSKIIFTSQPNDGSPQIWIMNSDGTNPIQLTETQGYSCDWSPDSKWIVYTDSRAINGRLWIMRKDGSQKHQITFD